MRRKMCATPFFDKAALQPLYETAKVLSRMNEESRGRNLKYEPGV